MRFDHVRESLGAALTDAGHVVGESLGEAGWRRAGGGRSLGGGGSGDVGRDALRRKRLLALEGGRSGAGVELGAKKQKKDVIDLTGSDDGTTTE